MWFGASLYWRNPSWGQQSRSCSAGKGGLGGGGVKGEGSTAAVVCHGNRKKAPESRAHTAAEEVFRGNVRGNVLTSRAARHRSHFP